MLLRERGAVTPMVYDLPADTQQVRSAMGTSCHNCSCGLSVVLVEPSCSTKQLTSIQVGCLG